MDRLEEIADRDDRTVSVTERLGHIGDAWRVGRMEPVPTFDAQRVVAQQRTRDTALPEILEAVQWAELEPALNTSGVEQDNLERLRHRKTPWFLLPAAWRARQARGQARRKIAQITRRVLATCGGHG